MSACAKQGIHLSGILGELGRKHFKTFSISTENRGALHLAANGNCSNRSKHIAIRFAALPLSETGSSEKTESSIDLVSTKDQLSDILTPKFCDKQTFEDLCTKVFNQGSKSSS